MEKWTAVRKDEQYIYFKVESPGKEPAEQRRNISAMPLMFALGGYPPVMGQLAAVADLPWSFDKNTETGQIYYREE